MILRTQTRVALLTFVLLAVSNAGNAFAQSVSITDPINSPVWITGNSASVTYTYSGVSLMRIKIYRRALTSDVFYSNTVTDNSSPAARNFTVPIADSGMTTECIIVAEGLNIMSQVVITDRIKVWITTP